MADLTTIKNWFKTGLKPTQTQFWAWMDSFWHKDEQIPQSAVQNLIATLNAKAEASQFNGHKTDPNAHSDLFALKEDKTQKGVPNGYAPLNEFGKILSDYLVIVDDLITGGNSSILSAEQGKELKGQIDAINVLLGSNDINLDTVQEIVDAIKAIENAFGDILINDLTTGGATKALTAEMGKLLQNNKTEKGGYLGTAKDLKDKQDAEVADRIAALVEANARIDVLRSDVTTELLEYQKINNQIYVSASTPVLDSWHGKLVTFTANLTVTVPATGLRVGFNFEGITDPSVTVNTAITTPKAWYGGYIGAAIPENSIFTFVQRSNDSNKITIYGL